MRTKPTNERRETAWLARGDLQRVFDMSGVALDKYILPHAPEDCVRRDSNGRRVAFYAAGIVATLIGQAADADSGPGSVNLEKLRAVRVELAQLQLSRARGESVNRSDARAGIAAVLGTMRVAADRARQCDRGCFEAWTAGLDAAVAEVEKLFPADQEQEVPLAPTA